MFKNWTAYAKRIAVGTRSVLQALVEKAVFAIPKRFALITGKLLFIAPHKAS